MMAGAVLAVFAGAACADTVPERLMADLQAHLDLKDFQAAGITGDLARETGNFRYLQELKPVVKNSKGGIGYAQWTGVRRVAFEEWASEDADLTSYEVNYGYLLEELRGDYAPVLERVRKTESLEEAATVFMTGYLRPMREHRNLDERIAYGEAYLAGDFSGAGCQDEHEVEIEGRMIVVAMCSPDSTTVTAHYADNEAIRPDPAASAEVHLAFGAPLAPEAVPHPRPRPVRLDAAAPVELASSLHPRPRTAAFGAPPAGRVASLRPMRRPDPARIALAEAEEGPSPL